MEKSRLARYRTVLTERLGIAADLAARAGPTRLSTRDMALVGEINAALDRIEAGSFGVCARCGRGPAPRAAARRDLLRPLPALSVRVAWYSPPLLEGKETRACSSRSARW
jgi:hypothetical protein